MFNIPFDINGLVEESYSKERRVYPCRSNRASRIGHPCERYLVYCRTKWQEAKLPPVELMRIFEFGRYVEKLAIARLEKAGFEISQQQRDFEDVKSDMTGHLDGFISREDSKEYPLEIKSISGYGFDKVNSMEDMLNSDKVWTKGYPAQLQAYMFFSDKELGVFYLVSKQPPHDYKPIWMEIDIDYCDKLLKKGERIKKHVSDDTIPERIPYNPDVCRKCDYEHICLPPAENNEELLIEEEPIIEEALNRRAEIEDMSKEYSKLDKKVKDHAKSREQDKINIGEWFIEKKTTTSMSKPKEAAEITRTTIKISKLGEEQ